MSTATAMLWRRARARVFMIAPLAAALTFATCTSGDAPLSPRSNGGMNRLSIRPQFVTLGGTFAADPINRIHLVARAQPSLRVFADTTIEVNPTDASWNLGIDLRLPDDQTSASVIVTIELINHSSAGESIQWSGETAPIAVVVGTVSPPPAPVIVFPGPPSNLTVTNVVISPDSLALVEGDSAKLNGAVSGSTGTPLVVWSTLDPTIAAVSASGFVRGLRNGTARVVAQAGPKADTTLVRFSQRLASINVVQDSAALGSIGEEVTLDVRGLDPRGDSIPGSTFSYTVRDPSIAQQSGPARFQARGNGRTFVIATSSAQPGLRDSALIAVTQRVASTTISPTNTTVATLGATTQHTAAARDALGNAMALTPTWSTDNALAATVDGNGLARAVSNGTAHITATFPGGSTATATFTVSQQVALITVTPATATLLSVNDTVRARANAQDANGNAMTGAVITWSTSDATVAVVDPNGLVRAVASGVATITARSGTATGTARITVAQRAARVTVSPRTATAASLGESVPFGVSATDANGGSITKPPATWRSTLTTVATVDANGVATATGNGAAFIVADVDGVRDSAQLTVRQVAARIALVSAPDSVAVGDTLRVRASAFDARNAPITSALFTWLSTAPSTAAVNSTGLVSGVTAGRSDITAALDGQSAVAHIVVFQPGPATLVATPDHFDFNAITQTQQTTAVIRDSRGNQLTNTPITFTSTAPAIVDVTPDGIMTSRALGSAGIIVRSGIAADTVPVTVSQVATSLVLSPDSAVLTSIGALIPFHATVRDRLGTPLPPVRVIYVSLNPGIASVDTAGRVTAVANGSTRMIASYNGVADTANVRVSAGLANLTVTPFIVSPNDTVRDNMPSSIQIKVRNTGTAASTPTTVHLRAKTSSTGPVLNTDSTGIPAILPGDSITINRSVMLDTVTQYPDSVFALVQVDANNTVVESNEADNTYGRTLRVQLSVGRVQVQNALGTVNVDSLLFDALGDSVKLTARGFDRFNRPLTGRRAFWVQASPGGPPAAGVDSSGLVRVFANGSILLAANMGARSDTFLVRVAQVPVTFNLFPDSLFMNVGDSAGINPHVYDRNAREIINARPIYGNTNPTVASFDTVRSFVHAMSTGTTIVRGTVGGLSDSVKVRVVAPALVINGLRVTKTWAGAGTVSWSDPLNWSPVGVPTAADTVYIRAVAVRPLMTQNEQVGALVSENGAYIDTGTSNLTVLGEIGDYVDVRGSGILYAGGTGSLRGKFPNLHVSGVRNVIALTEVRGNLVIDDGGDLTTYTSVYVSGGVTLQSSGVIRMPDPGSEINVTGDFYINRSVEGPNTFTAGNLRVGGNFHVGGAATSSFRPSGTHKVTFTGNTTQTIAFDLSNGSTYFHNVEFANTDLAVGVRLLNNIYIYGLAAVTTGRVSGDAVANLGTGLSAAAGNAWNVRDTRVRFQPTVMPAQMNTNLFVAGPYQMLSDLTLNGNVTIETGATDPSAFSVNGHTFNVSGGLWQESYGQFTMSDPAGSMSVGGDVYLNPQNNGLNEFSAGLLKVGGNFHIGGSAGTGFSPTGSFKVEFNGANQQNVDFAYQNGFTSFRNVDFANSSGAGVIFFNNIFIKGLARVISGSVHSTSIVNIGTGLQISSATAWDVASTRVTVQPTSFPTAIKTTLRVASTFDLLSDVALDGSVIVEDLGHLRPNGHRLDVTRNFSLDSDGEVKMNNAADVLSVRGDYYMNPHTLRPSDMSAGELRVGGNFHIGGWIAPAFQPSGTHTVVLDGAASQTVNFDRASTETFFRNLQIENLIGVTVAQNGGITSVTGGLKVKSAASLNVPTGQTVDVMGLLVLEPSSVTINNGTILYGSLQAAGAIVTGTGVMMAR